MLNFVLSPLAPSLTISFPMTPRISTNRLVSMAMDKAGSPEMEKLREQFAAFDLCADKRAAAIFGYLLAKEETNAKSPETDVYDKVCAVLELYEEGSYGDVTDAADKVFSMIYKWLDKQEGLNKEALKEAFANCLPPVDA
jgi:hypothetical protein